MSTGQNRAGKNWDGTSLAALVSSTLSAHVGPGRYISPDGAGLLAGVAGKTMRRYVDGATIPDMVVGLRLMRILPDTFAADILRGAGFAGAFRVVGASPAPETLREMLEGAAALAQALVDGRVDHTEWPKVRQEMTEAMTAMSRFLAAQADKFEAGAP